MIEVIKEIAVKAGEKILEIYDSEDFSIEKKGDNSPLTKADKASNDIIVDFLKNKYPDIAILSEEEKDNLDRLKNKKCFIVDPLDGTKEFIKRNGEFTVNIALAENNKTILGVIYVPVTQEIFYSEKGYGAFYKNLKTGEEKQLHVSDKLDKLIAVGSRSHQSEEFKKIMDEKKNKIDMIKSFGSSLKGCMVALGVADIYYRFGPTMEWDTAAMQCIVEEAGGIMKFIDGSEINYNRSNSLNKGFYIVNREENIFI